MFLGGVGAYCQCLREAKTEKHVGETLFVYVLLYYVVEGNRARESPVTDIAEADSNHCSSLSPPHQFFAVG